MRPLGARAARSYVSAPWRRMRLPSSAATCSVSEVAQAASTAVAGLVPAKAWMRVAAAGC